MVCESALILHYDEAWNGALLAYVQESNAKLNFPAYHLTVPYGSGGFFRLKMA